MKISRRSFSNTLFLGGVGLLGESTFSSDAWARKALLPFPLLKIKGSAHLIGETHGKRFQREIKHNISFYLRWFDQVIGLNSKNALSCAEQFGKVIKDISPELFEEIEGIAKGASVSRSEILAINARTDLLVKGKSFIKKDKRSTPGCTALALRSKTRFGNELALGQNWDWRSDLSNSVVLLDIERKNTPRLITFCEAGMVGKIGMNENRLGVCLNFLSHQDDSPDADYGYPVHVLLRAVMEKESLKDAEALIKKVPRCASANFLMAQASKKESKAIDIEYTSKRVSVLPMKNDALVHTNHYLDKELVKGCQSEFGRSTMNRFKMASKLGQDQSLKDKEKNPALRMQMILRNRKGNPYSVSKTAAKDSKSQTLASIVMNLTRGQLYICKGQPHKGRYALFRFKS